MIWRMMAWISATISASSLSGAGLCGFGFFLFEGERRPFLPPLPPLSPPSTPLSFFPILPFPGHHRRVRLHVERPPLQHVPLGAARDHQHEPAQRARAQPALEVLEHCREVGGELVVRGDGEREAVLLLLLEGLGRVDAALVQDAEVRDGEGGGGFCFEEGGGGERD